MLILRRSFFVDIGAICKKNRRSQLASKVAASIFIVMCAYSADASGSVYQREYIR